VRPALGDCSAADELASVIIVEDVAYRPRRWSWDVEAVCEAALDELPANVSRRTRAWIEAVRDKL
jgi:hypothetical protein